MDNAPSLTIESKLGLKSNKLFLFALLWLGGIFAGMNASIFGVVLPEALNDLLQNPSRQAISHWGSWIMSSFLFGWMAGGILLGIAADRYGRVLAMTVSILFYACFTGLAGLARNPFDLMICRFLAGVGVGGEMLCISILLAEHFSSGSRALAIGALITSYQAGVFLSGFVAALFPDWRISFGVGALPAVLALASFFGVEESPRWKMRNEIQDKPASLSLFQGGYRWSLFVGTVAFGSLLIGYWASLSWTPTWIQSLLSETATGQEKNTATMLHAFAAILGCVLAGVLSNGVGRIPVIIASFSGAFFVSAWMFLGNDVFSSKIYFQYALLGLCAGVAQAVMYIYLPELFPTDLRATAVGFCLNIGRIITATAVFFVGVFVTWLGGYPTALFCFSLFYLLGPIVILFGKETRAQALPD